MNDSRMWTIARRAMVKYRDIAEGNCLSDLQWEDDDEDGAPPTPEEVGEVLEWLERHLRG